MNKPSISRKSKTNWARLQKMSDRSIDHSDIPELTPKMFARAVLRQGLKPRDTKAQLTIRVDQDVLKWFRSQGRGYQTRINSLLRAYMEANARHHKSGSTRAQR